MNTILVVSECYKSYDDGWSTPILVTSDLRSEVTIKEMETLAKETLSNMQENSFWEINEVPWE